MAINKTRSLEYAEFAIRLGYCRIEWVVRVQEDGEEIASRTAEKRYTEQNQSELDADLGALMANRVRNIMGWV